MSLLTRYLPQIVKDALYNRRLYMDGIANKHKGVYTAVGWQPDESYTKQKMNPSGNPNGEYSKPIKRIRING